MPLIWLLVLEDMLACESRMVTHVTISATQSRILGSPSIKIKNLLDPLHIRLLMLLLKVVIPLELDTLDLLDCPDRGNWGLY